MPDVGKSPEIILDTPADKDAKDPTINVQNLLRAAIIRVDDLREAETRRVNEILAAESRRINEQLALRTEYEGLLREAEAKRIDAIRVVDVTAVAVANERATAQAAVLANQVAVSADTLRALVSSTAASVAQQLAQVTAQLTDRLASLEKSSYEGQGKQAYSDPMLAQLINEVKSLRESQSQVAGRGSGIQASWLILLGVISLIGMLIGIAGAIIAFVR